MENKTPLVSVIMSVYNGERFLRDAVDSILSQTYTNFEFIIINDGSTDRTSKILDSYTDRRLRIFNQPNQGLIRSLNRALKLSRGTYIARQDADDLSVPNRLEIQVNFLETHPDIAGVGSYVLYMNERGEIFALRTFKIHPAVIRKTQQERTGILHGSMMYRRSVIDVIGMYNEKIVHAEDYDFCLRMVEKFNLSNIPQPLYIVREHGGQISTIHRQEQRKSAELARELARRRRNGYGGMESGNGL